MIWKEVGGIWMPVREKSSESSDKNVTKRDGTESMIENVVRSSIGEVVVLRPKPVVD
jgi:hypothetical protein